MILMDWRYLYFVCVASAISVGVAYGNYRWPVDRQAIPNCALCIDYRSGSCSDMVGLVRTAKHFQHILAVYLFVTVVVSSARGSRRCLSQAGMSNFFPSPGFRGKRP